MEPTAPRSKDIRYDIPKIWLHWMTVGLIAALWVIGQTADWVHAARFAPSYSLSMWFSDSSQASSF